MRKHYTVRVMRPVFQTITLEVEAWSKGSAVRKAIHRALNAEDGDWHDQPTNGEDYSLHVEAVLDHEEVHESSPNPQKRIREFRSMSGQGDAVRYLLLAADTEKRDGRFLVQPWFDRADPLLQVDLCSDWVEPLSFIIENDGVDAESVISAIDESPNVENVIEFPLDRSDEEVGSQS